MSIHGCEDGALITRQLPLPSIFKAPIRPDVVHFVHSNIAKNHRQVNTRNLNLKDTIFAVSQTLIHCDICPGYPGLIIEIDCQRLHIFTGICRL